MIAVYVVLVLGISTIFWSLVGLLRLANEQYIQRVTLGPPTERTRPPAPAAMAVGQPDWVRHSRRPRVAGAKGAPRGAAAGAWPPPCHRPGRSQANVAILIAAHNEALVIRETIRTASVLVPLRNIHVISDMSTDDTAAIARAAGVKVLELEPNRGKAGAQPAAGIAHFELCRKFKVVMLLDADTRPNPDYLEDRVAAVP